MHAMVGSRSGETHRLGDRVTVRLVEAAPVAGALRFELLSEGRITGGAARSAPARPRSERARARPQRTAASPEPAQARKAAAMTDLTDTFCQAKRRAAIPM